MKLLKKRCINILLLGMSIFATASNCMAEDNLLAEGSLFGKAFSSKVDSELAVKMLENPADSAVVQLFSDYQNFAFDARTLEEITEKHSIDVATLFLLQKLYEKEENTQLQQDYLLADSLSEAEINAKIASLKDFHVVFVPGFKYENNAGNFLQQRQLLDSVGISQEIILFDEWGLPADNAAMVAERLKEANQKHDKIILVSVSKGGLEAALALSEMLKPEEFSSVKAWINVCGVLKGTPVADYLKNPFRKAGLYFAQFFIGKPGIKVNKLLDNLSYEYGKERYKNLSVPQEMYVVNLIATELGREDESKIAQPNDGFSPLLDSIIGDDAVVVEIGIGHTFEHIDLNSRMAVLLYHIANRQY